MSEGGREENSPLLGNDVDLDVSLRGGVAHLGQEMHARPVKTKGVVSFSEASPGATRSVSRLGPRAANLQNRARRTGWICIDSEGNRSFLHADKRAVIQGLSLNIPIRDMRLLDFNLFTSGKILVRDNAIIFTIEHVRLIVTANKVIIPREGYEHHPMSSRYVDALEEAIQEWHRCQVEMGMADDQENPAGEAYNGSPARGDAGRHSDNEDEGSGGWRHDYEMLPFELVVLEVALKEVVAATTLQVNELESVALPAMDSLTRRINSATLERVRKVKTRHQRLLIRCETLRDEMERFLGDDDDMMKMCLTRRRELEQSSPRHPDSMLGTPSFGRAGSHPLHHSGSGSLARRSPFHRVNAGAGSPPAGHTAGSPGLSGAMSMETHFPTAPPTEDDLAADMEVVENLLESYYMQIDGLYDKVVSLDEYIKDTEEYINIELDASRNKLIRLDIILTAAAFSIAPFNLLAGILGENLVIPTFLTKDVSRFWSLNLVAGTLCLLSFAFFVRYMRYRRLI